MHDELITALRTCVDKDKDCPECPYYERCMHTSGKHAAMVDAADAIEELQEDNAALNGTVSNLIGQIAELSKSRWIPVTERLPDYPGRFMCYYEVNDYGEIGHCIDWGRYDPDDGWYAGGVTHWMPSPQAPELPEEE